MREIKRVTYMHVNSMAVIDGNFQKMIVRKPKKRYRTIIRNFYKTDAFVKKLRNYS